MNEEQIKESSMEGKLSFLQELKDELSKVSINNAYGLVNPIEKALLILNHLPKSNNEGELNEIYDNLTKCKNGYEINKDTWGKSKNPKKETITKFNQNKNEIRYEIDNIIKHINSEIKNDKTNEG